LCTCAARWPLIVGVNKNMKNGERGVGLTAGIWILVGLLVLTALGIHVYWAIRGTATRFSTPYQAVLLTNGSVISAICSTTALHTPS